MIWWSFNTEDFKKNRSVSAARLCAKWAEPTHKRKDKQENDNIARDANRTCCLDKQGKEGAESQVTEIAGICIPEGQRSGDAGRDSALEMDVVFPSLCLCANL